jgi:hypothetical protein
MGGTAMRTDGWALLATSRRRMLWSGTLVVCLVLAVGAGPALADRPVCGDGVCQGNEPRSCPADCGGGGGGGGGDGKIPVKVTFRDSVVPPIDRVMSDCGTGDCPYIDKVANVSATVGASFSLKKDKNNQPSGPELHLDFLQCAELICTPPFLNRLLLATVVAGDDWREMSPGEERTGMDLTVVFVDDEDVGRANEGRRWWLFFKNDRVDYCSLTSGVTVTRTHDEIDTWVVEATVDDIACLVTLEDLPGSPPSNVRKGYFSMPFQMTVERE